MSASLHRKAYQYYFDSTGFVLWAEILNKDYQAIGEHCLHLALNNCSKGDNKMTKSLQGFDASEYFTNLNM